MSEPRRTFQQRQRRSHYAAGLEVTGVTGEGPGTGVRDKEAGQRAYVTASLGRFRPDELIWRRFIEAENKNQTINQPYGRGDTRQRVNNEESFRTDHLMWSCVKRLTPPLQTEPSPTSPSAVLFHLPGVSLWPFALTAQIPSRS